MATEQVRRLPVVTDGRLVGILAQADIARTARPESTAGSSRRSRPRGSDTAVELARVCSRTPSVSHSAPSRRSWVTSSTRRERTRDGGPRRRRFRRGQGRARRLRASSSGRPRASPPPDRRIECAQNRELKVVRALDGSPPGFRCLRERASRRSENVRSDGIVSTMRSLIRVAAVPGRCVRRDHLDSSGVATSGDFDVRQRDVPGGAAVLYVCGELDLATRLASRRRSRRVPPMRRRHRLSGLHVPRLGGHTDARGRGAPARRGRPGPSTSSRRTRASSACSRSRGRHADRRSSVRRRRLAQSVGRRRLRAGSRGA